MGFRDTLIWLYCFSLPGVIVLGLVGWLESARDRPRFSLLVAALASFLLQLGVILLYRREVALSLPKVHAPSLNFFVPAIFGTYALYRWIREELRLLRGAEKEEADSVPKSARWRSGVRYKGRTDLPVFSGKDHAA